MFDILGPLFFGHSNRCQCECQRQKGPPPRYGSRMEMEFENPIEVGFFKGDQRLLLATSRKASLKGFFEHEQEAPELWEFRVAFLFNDHVILNRDDILPDIDHIFMFDRNEFIQLEEVVANSLEIDFHNELVAVGGTCKDIEDNWLREYRQRKSDLIGDSDSGTG